MMVRIKDIIRRDGYIDLYLQHMLERNGYSKLVEHVKGTATTLAKIDGVIGYVICDQRLHPNNSMFTLRPMGLEDL